MREFQINPKRKEFQIAQYEIWIWRKFILLNQTKEFEIFKQSILKMKEI